MFPVFRRPFAITTSNTVNFTQPCNAIYVGVAGDVSILPLEGATSVVFKAVPVGILHVPARRVNASGTTATDLVGLGVS